MVRDTRTGKYRRTRLFVTTLGYSRKSVRLVVPRSSAQVWAELHERAFLCEQIHRNEGEPAVRRILGMLALARKHGVPAVDDAATAALEMGAPTYRFVRTYLERRPPVPLSLRQVDR